MAVIRGADLTLAGRCPPATVVDQLLRTVLFLPVAGLARTWDLRHYTGTMLALLSGRQRAYSQGYTEQFLASLARTQAAERLTATIARWAWSLWQEEPTPPDRNEPPAVFYVDGHRKPVYSAVLVPRGPVGRLGGKILGCRELVLLHDERGHPLLAMTFRGDQHLTIGAPLLLSCYEQATDQGWGQRVVVDREGMAAEFLAQQQLAGRQVVTLLKADQYESEGSFDQVGAWHPWRFNRAGQVICEVAAARFALPRPDPTDPAVEVVGALIRDWRKLLPAGPEAATTEHDWQRDQPQEAPQFWEEGWQALPAPPVPKTPKLLAVVSTGRQGDAMELAQTYFQRWNCQENIIRDWLLPLNLDTNHGYAKEQVVNSELAKRQGVAQRRAQRLQRLAQACRVRLGQAREQEEQLEAAILADEQRRRDLVSQVSQLEEAGRTEEREYFPVKARQVAVDWEVRQNKTRLEKNELRRARLMDKCEEYCRELRHVLRDQEDLQTQARAMYELDHSKDQLMTLFKVGLANLGMWVRDRYFGASYQNCGWQRLLPFFQLGGWVTATTREVRLEVCAFNNRALGRDLEEVCHKVNEGAVTLPDGRRLVMTVGQRLRAGWSGPLAHTG